MKVDVVFVLIFTFEMFFFGLFIGYEMSKRNDPNEPKPKNWEDKLHKRWMDGFKAGEKAMAKRMSERLKKEEITRIMWEGYDAERNENE